MSGASLLDLVPVALGGLFGFVVAVGVIDAVFDHVGEILLPDPVVREIVRVEIALVALEARAVGVDILQLARDGAGSSCLHIGDGRIDGHAAGIGLRGRGKEKNRVGQRQTRLRQAQLQSAVDAGLDDPPPRNTGCGGRRTADRPPLKTGPDSARRRPGRSRGWTS